MKLQLSLEVQLFDLCVHTLISNTLLIIQVKISGEGGNWNSVISLQPATLIPLGHGIKARMHTH